MLINYMPVGSQKATEFYAQACLEAGIGFINCMPVLSVLMKNGRKNLETKDCLVSEMILNHK